MYLQHLWSEVKEQENYWFFEQTFNGYVDFCVWVLQVDGLRLHPFNRHPDGDSTLRERGLNAEAWQLWLTRVVATQDSRLHGHVLDIETQVAREVADLKVQINQLKEQGVMVPDPDWSMIGSSTRRRLVRNEQQYQKATQQLGELSKDVTPPEAWNGAPEVGERLRQLWEDYRLISNRSNRGTARAMEIETLPFSALQQYQTRLDTLKIYLVDYPEPVEYLIPPISILLSFADELHDSEDFRIRAINAVERLSILLT